MTALMSKRKRFTSVLATATAALVVASGMSLAPTVAFAAEAPVLTVAPATGLTDGDAVTVTGSGYNPNQAIYVTTCTDAELADVDFGFINQGCTDGAALVWQHGAGRGLEFDADGSFSTTMNLKQREGTTALYTIANHTAMGDRSQDAKADVRFGAPVALTANVAEAKADGLTVSFAAQNIQLLPGDVGVYFALIEKGTEADLGQTSQGASASFVFRSKIVDGAVAQTLPAATMANLDRAKQYEVLVWRAHGNATPDRIVARVDVPITSSQWDAVSKKEEPKPEVKIPFTDVKKGDKFFKEISWMYTAKITTGVKQADGSVKYLPKGNVTREAMAAFLFRQYGEAGYVAPKKSVFTDVKPGDKFYKEVAWMADKGYSTGNKQADGKTFKYLPKESVTREAMAAFIYRIEKDKPATKKVSFNDVKPGHKFYKEISWMGGTGVSTGNKLSNGTYDYKPSDSVTREAMAAFMQRADAL